MRLPPYHCELNPIELIWSQIKGYVVRQNNVFKLKSVVNLDEDAIVQISTFDWKRACEHTAKIEEEYKKNDGIRPRQPHVQVNVNDTSTSSESESSSSSSDSD